jgi:hypothetical protein
VHNILIYAKGAERIRILKSKTDGGIRQNRPFMKNHPAQQSQSNSSKSNKIQKTQ